jgi:hypothetical protein
MSEKSGAADIEAEGFVWITAALKALFQDLESVKGVFDNNYFVSYLYLGDEVLVLPTQKLNSKSDVITLIKASLFSSFAYAELTVSEKESASLKFYNKLVYKFENQNIEFFKGPIKKSKFKVELHSSCDVYTSKDKIYITLKKQRKHALMLASDVCD